MSSEYLGQVHISRSLASGPLVSPEQKKLVCVSCSWVVCLRLKGDLVYCACCLHDVGSLSLSGLDGII